MKKFDFNEALPYLIGGAFLLFVWKRFFKNKSVPVIEKDILSSSVKYITMSEKEKDDYALSQANLIGNILSVRIGSRFRNNDDVIAIIKGNDFCIVRIGKMWDNSTRWFQMSLSNYLWYSLSDVDMLKINNEVEKLRKNGY